MDYEEYYSNICNNSNEWYSLAVTLKRATKPLEENLKKLMELCAADDSSEEYYSLYLEAHVYYMLWGYSIENLLKAIIVKKNSEDDKKVISKLPTVIKSHDLLKLVESAHVSYLSRDYPDILSKLKECIIWYGRYPVPISARDYKKPGSGHRTSISLIHINDLNIIFRTLEGELNVRT